MVQFIPARNEWAEGFGQLGSGLAQGYMNRTDENAVRKAILDLGPNASAKDILSALTNTKTYSPEAKQNALKNYLGVEEFEELKRKNKSQEAIDEARNAIASAKESREAAKPDLERTQTRNIVDQLDLPEEQKSSLRENIDIDTAQSLLKEQVKSKSGEDKKTKDKNAEDYVKLVRDEIPELETTLEDIAYARKLSDEMSVFGIAGSPFNLSGKGKELEGVSFTLMKPIVKMFNPSGPIAQQKLKMIQDKYVVYGSDAPWTKKAKLDALERFAKQALNRAQKKVEMIREYDGNPPKAVEEQFDRESDTLSDAMLNYDITAEEISNPALPPAAEYSGETVNLPDGTKAFSDGTRWIKKK